MILLPFLVLSCCSPKVCLGWAELMMLFPKSSSSSSVPLPPSLVSRAELVQSVHLTLLLSFPSPCAFPSLSRPCCALPVPRLSFINNNRRTWPTLQQDTWRMLSRVSDKIGSWIFPISNNKRGAHDSHRAGNSAWRRQGQFKSLVLSAVGLAVTVWWKPWLQQQQIRISLKTLQQGLKTLDYNK